MRASTSLGVEAIMGVLHIWLRHHHVFQAYPHTSRNLSYRLFFYLILTYIMPHHRYVSWSNPLTTVPTYPPPGAGTDYPSPAASRRASVCVSDVSSSRRGSMAGFASEMESAGQWQSLGSEAKSPLAQFGFFKSLTDKKTTRGLHIFQLILQSAHAPQMVRRPRGEVQSRTANRL